MPRASTSPGFVARYTLGGEQVWFTEFEFDASQLSMPAKDPVGFFAIAVSGGNIVVATGGQGPVAVTPGNFALRNTNYLFALKQSDGSLL